MKQEIEQQVCLQYCVDLVCADKKQADPKGKAQYSKPSMWSRRITTKNKAKTEILSISGKNNIS